MMILTVEPGDVADGAYSEGGRSASDDCGWSELDHYCQFLMAVEVVLMKWLIGLEKRRERKKDQDDGLDRTASWKHGNIASDWKTG